MKLSFIIIWTMVILSSQSDALACTYYYDGPPAKSVSQLFKESEIVVRGHVLYIDDRGLNTKDFNRVARLEVLEFIKAPKKITSDKNIDTPPVTVDVLYQFVGAGSANDCDPPLGTHFVTGQEYLIFAKRDNKSNLYVTHTSGKHGLTYIYNEQQIVEYIHKGKDSQLKVEFCYPSLRLAYAEDIFIDKFPETQRAPCINDFSRIYRTYTQKKETKP